MLSHIPAQRTPIHLSRPAIGEAEIAAATTVLRGGHVAQGPEVAAFEDEFSTALAAGAHCIAVNSGTSALHLSLLALGIAAGDEVIVPSFSFAATANAVRLVGATPVFADIDPTTYCLDPAAAAAAITARTAAIIPVHLYGHPAAMDTLTPLADRHQLALIEDACQAHAATLDGAPVGTFGAAGAFSFYPSKNMTALEGGMITTSDPHLARTLRLLRNQGMEQRYVNEIVGGNWRMTDVAAAVGRVQLSRLPGWTEQRRANARALGETLPAVSDLAAPEVAEGALPVWHQYVVRVPGGAGERERAQRVFAAHGITTGVYYPTPIHRLAPYRGAAGARAWVLPHTQAAAGQVLALPVHPGLSPDDLLRIARAASAAVPARAGAPR